MGVQQNVTKGSFTNVLSPILKLPLNRRMSEKESAELKTIGGNGNAMGMVNFVHRILHVSSKALPLVLTWREKRVGIRKPKR